MSINSQWGSLPSLIISQIYDYLSHVDRLRASSTCWHWRNIVFQARFFQNNTFAIRTNNFERNEFYIYRLALIVRKLIIHFDSLDVFNFDAATQLINKLSTSLCLVQLTFRPSISVHLPGMVVSSDRDEIFRYFIRPIIDLLQRRDPPMEILDLGSSPVLCSFADDILFGICRPQFITRLNLASVRLVANTMTDVHIRNANMFAKFQSLQLLSVDFEVVNDEFLAQLQSLPLKQLTIHVQHIDQNKDITEEAWANLVRQNPSLEVHLILIHSRQAAANLKTGILRPSIPLSHLKVLLCKFINTPALEYLCTYYNKTLKSLVWVDSIAELSLLEQETGFERYVLANQDPLVMIAWRCKKLQELIVHGYPLDPLNLIGIARLKGSALKTLTVSNMDLNEEFSWLNEEISSQLGHKWAPVPIQCLHTALRQYPIADIVREDYVRAVILANPVD